MVGGCVSVRVCVFECLRVHACDYERGKSKDKTVRRARVRGRGR